MRSLMRIGDLRVGELMQRTMSSRRQAAVRVA